MIKIVRNFILLSFFFLAACQTDTVEEAALDKSATTSWALKHYISGGFDGRVELVTIRSDGVIQIEDLMRETKVSGRVKNKRDLDFIYSQLVIAKKQFDENKNSINQESNINPKDNIKVISQCRDCQTTSLSFEFNNVDYPVSHTIKSNGKSIYTELMKTIVELQKSSLIN